MVIRFSSIDTLIRLGRLKFSGVGGQGARFVYLRSPFVVDA